jgi:hypothetical protein
VQPSPLTTAITPLTGNSTTSATPTFTFSASNTFANALPVNGLYFQFDSWLEPWTPATAGSGGSYSGTAPSLTAGTHILYAYATDGQDATATNTAYASVPLIGSISAYLFTVSAPASTPVVSLTPTLPFPNTTVGTTSSALAATLSNTGTAPLSISSISIAGTNPSDFAVSTGTNACGASLAAGSSCSIYVTFTPALATSYSAMLQVADNASGSPQATTLSGTGTAPVVSLVPSPVPFGNQTIDTTSTPAMVVVLMNTGNATLTGISISVTGTNASAFGLNSSACGATLTAGSSCNISLNFTPTTTGANSASLSVSDNASNSPQSVSLTGTGLAANVVAPSPLVFNPAPVGISLASAQTLTATFQVNGYAAGFTPTAKLHYGLSYSIGAVNCSGAAGSETCSVPVTFQPQYPGAHKDALLLMNGTTVLSTVLVGGVGQAPFALVQPGVVTSPILSGSTYFYQSAVGEDGTAFVVSSISNAIYSVTKAGVVTQLPIAGLSSPHGIAVDGAGTLYIAQNTYSKQIITYTAAGVQGAITVVPPAPYIPCSNSNGGTLEYLYAVAVDQTGNLFALELLCNQIFKLSPSGVYTTTTISPVMTQPSTMTVDSADNVFIGGYAINELTALGVQTQINTVGSGDGLGVDAADSLYATRYTGTSGVAELPATGYGTFEAALDLGSSPLGASVGPDGTVYVGNYTNLDKVDRSQGLIAFGEQFQTLGTASPQQIVTIYNGGNQTLTISNIAISGSPFSIQAAATGTNCTNGSTVAPGALCQIAVVMTPVHAGVFNGSITVTSNSLNASSTTQTIALTAFTYGVYVTPSPTSLTFPNQIVSTTSAAQTITLTNNGDLYTASFGTPSSASSVYSVGLGTCTTALAVGASCNLSITFTPALAQSYNNVTVTVPYSSSGGGTAPAPVTFTLNGTGISAAAPQAVLSPNPLAFPGTIVGASTALPITLSNPGTAALTITSISVTGTNASSFGQSNNCGASLAAGSTCTVTVTFTPASAAAFTAAISVADNASGSPHTAALTGTGIKFVSNVGTALAAQAVGVFFTTAGTLNSAKPCASARSACRSPLAGTGRRPPPAPPIQSTMDAPGAGSVGHSSHPGA